MSSSLIRELETLNITFTNLNNIISNTQNALEKMVEYSKIGEESFRKILFPKFFLKEYWLEIYVKLDKAEKIKDSVEVERLTKHVKEQMPSELVPTSLEIILGCGGGEPNFRVSLANFVSRMFYYYRRQRIEEFDLARYLYCNSTLDAYIKFLWNLSKNWLLKDNDVHELMLSMAIAIQQLRIVAAQEEKKVDRGK